MQSMRKMTHSPNMTDRGKLLTSYSPRHTKRLRGTRKMLMMVERSSSGTYLALRAIMEGQNTPMQPSNRQKASSWTRPSHVMPPLPFSTREEPASWSRCSRWKRNGTAMATADSTKTATMKRSTLARLMSMPVRALPAMHAVMKHEKTMPWGIFSPEGLRAGVQRKTNVYMDASNMDCMAPSSTILRSLTMAFIATLNCWPSDV
mmetsp:Transcript_5039/g.10933  ORF Transcript_5039/g.10933 Transcript_5039/m.10933 type:complete len:204 (+) Transcript_5039:855-1466(+)